MFGKRKNADQKELTKKDIKQLLANCKCCKVKDAPPNPWRVESLPEMRMRDKVTDDMNLAVTTSAFDPKTKSISVEFVVRVDQTDRMQLTYEQICNHFGWKSFTVSENCQTVYPVWQ